MNTAQKLTRSNPKEIITEMNAINPNLLLNAVATDPKHLTDLIMIYQGQLQNSNKKVVDNATKRLEDLQNILDYKVVLTKMAFGLYDESDVIQEIQTQIEFLEYNIIKHDFVNNKTITNQVKPSFYNRSVILGTSTELPKDIMKLIDKADNAGKIDEITRMMINLKRPEEALNLAIDLFDKLSLKTREEVEKRFMFETLPVTKGVKLTNSEEKGLGNMTLEKWVKYLDECQVLIKTKNNVVSEAVKESKKLSTKEQSRHISFKTQLELEKFNRIDPIIEDEVINMIAKELKVKPEDLVYDALNNTDKRNLEARGIKNIFITGAIEDAVIIEKVKELPITLADFKANVIEKFNDTSAGDKKIQRAHEYFDKNFKFITDLDNKENKEVHNKVWNELRETYKQSIGTTTLATETSTPVTKVEVKGFAIPKEETITTTEIVSNKDAIVEEAFDKAIELEQKEKSLPETIVKLRAEVQEIINSKCLNPLNKIRSTVKLHKNELKKQGIKVPDPIELFKELSGSDVIAELSVTTTTPVVEEKKVEIVAPKSGIQYDPIDVEKEYPEIWDGAKLCNNLGDFVAYVTMLLEDPDKNKDIKATSGRTATKTFVVCQLSNQYLGKLEECKAWDTHKKANWWITIKNKYANQKESGIPNVVKESSGIIKTEGSTEKKDGKPGEVKSSASPIALPAATQPIATKQSAGQQNVNQKPVGTTKVATPNVSTEGVKDSNPTKVGETKKNPILTNTATEEVKSSNIEPSSNKKDGVTGEQQPIVDTTSSIEKKNVKDVSTQAVVVTTKEEETKVGEQSAGSKEQNSKKEEEPAHKEQEDGQKVNTASGEATVQSNQNVKTNTNTTGNGQNQNSAIQQNVGSTVIANGDKYSEIIKEKDNKLIRKLIEEIILDTTSPLTFSQKIEKIVSVDCIKKNRKWDKAPSHEIMNFISSIVKSIKVFSETKEAIDFIASVEAKRLEVQNAKKKK